MVILECTSESGDNYIFKANRKPSKEEFDSYCKEHHPDEYDDEEGYNYIEITSCTDIEDIDEINLKTLSKL